MQRCVSMHIEDSVYAVGPSRYRKTVDVGSYVGTGVAGQLLSWPAPRPGYLAPCSCIVLDQADFLHRAPVTAHRAQA